MEIRFPKKKNLIRSSQIKRNDIIRFEYGDYDNTITVRIDSVSYPSHLSTSRYSQELIWHYLSDEKAEAERDCHAEKLGNQSAGTSAPPYEQHTCYSNPNDLVEKLN